MKSRIFIITLLIVSVFFSCTSDDNFNYKNEYEVSKSAWLEFKKINNNSYQYTVTNSSWVGFSWETKLTIENGKIIKRGFRYTSTNGLSENTPRSELEWTENENEIGTHENGAKPLTLDQVYDEAQNKWLIKRENSKIYFERENDGLISTCGYVENNCVDDCFIGITISSISSLKNK